MIDNDPRDTVWMCRAFAGLYASGATLVLATLGLHSGPDRSAPVIVVAAAVAYLVVALLLLSERRMTRSALALFPPLGTLLATVVVISGGTNAVAAYAMIYFWVVLATFAFFSPRAGLLNLVLVGAAYGAAITFRDPPAPVLRWVMGMGALTVAGLLVAVLKSQLIAMIDRLRRSATQQEAVARVGRRSLADADDGELATFAAAEVKNTVGAEQVLIFRRPGDKASFILDAAAGPAIAFGRRSIAADDEKLIRKALRSRGAVIEAAAVDDGGERSKNRIAVAIQGGRRPRRVLVAHFDSQFDRTDARFLEAVAAVLGDAERRRHAEDLLRRQALEDPLTGTPNRALFVDRLGEASIRAPRAGRQLGVFILGIDDFRLINDGLGHGAGDELLQRLAPRLRSTLFITDTVARLGSDEFAVLCEGLHEERDAVLVAERMLASLREPFEIDGSEVRISATMGLTISDGLADPNELIVRADAAMCRAKLQNRGGYLLFDETLRQRMQNRLQFEHALRGAVENRELQLFYQPIVALGDAEQRGSEALLRWRHSGLGPVSPGEFIPVAEESGAILPIGEWVLHEAFSQAAAWRAEDGDRAPLPLHVNVSPRQFAQRDFVELVARTLEQTGAEPSDIAVELTEHALVHDLAAAAVTLNELKEMGVITVLDDFGTGYSSLSHLKQLPIDIVKVDRLFVCNIETEPRDAAIVEAVVGIAGAFGMQVVAEGVETPAQAERLRELGCELAQGFLFGRPGPQLPATGRRVPGISA